MHKDSAAAPPGKQPIPEGLHVFGVTCRRADPCREALVYRADSLLVNPSNRPSSRAMRSRRSATSSRSSAMARFVERCPFTIKPPRPTPTLMMAMIKPFPFILTPAHQVRRASHSVALELLLPHPSNGSALHSTPRATVRCHRPCESECACRAAGRRPGCGRGSSIPASATASAARPPTGPRSDAPQCSANSGLLLLPVGLSRAAVSMMDVRFAIRIPSAATPEPASIGVDEAAQFHPKRLNQLRCRP